MRKIKYLQTDADNQAYKIFGETSGILDWNQAPKQFYDFYKRLRENFWIADKVSMANDIKDYQQVLTEEEKEAYKRIIGSLAVLDSVQSRYIYDVMGTIPNPAVSAVFAEIASQEVLHNQSYSYTFSTLVSKQEQAEIFDIARRDEEMMERMQMVFDVYDEFKENPNMENLLKTFVANMALEGIFFFSGFTFFYLLAKANKMQGTASMIQFIHRDENLHAYIIAHTLRAILTENPEYNTAEFNQFTKDFLKQATELEKKWIKRAVSSVEEADVEDFVSFIEYNANIRASSLGLEHIYPAIGVNNPVPWLKAFGSNTDVFTDFFERTVTSYSEVADSDFDDLE